MEDQEQQTASWQEKNPAAAQVLMYGLLFVTVTLAVWAGITLAHKSI